MKNKEEIISAALLFSACIISVSAIIVLIYKFVKDKNKKISFKLIILMCIA